MVSKFQQNTSTEKREYKVKEVIGIVNLNEDNDVNFSSAANIIKRIGMKRGINAHTLVRYYNSKPMCLFFINASKKRGGCFRNFKKI